MFITDEELTEPKAEFNKRYGAWIRECRQEKRKSLATVAAATGVDIATLRDIEDGKCIELNDAMRLWRYFGIEVSDDDE